MFTMRLLLAAALTAGLAFMPVAGAQDTAKSATSKQKTNRSAKAHKKAPRIVRPSEATTKTDSPLGYPYTMQKDEMTR